MKTMNLSLNKKRRTWEPSDCWHWMRDLWSSLVMMVNCLSLLLIRRENLPSNNSRTPGHTRCLSYKCLHAPTDLWLLATIAHCRYGMWFRLEVRQFAICFRLPTCLAGASPKDISSSHKPMNYSSCSTATAHYRNFCTGPCKTRTPTSLIAAR